MIIEKANISDAKEILSLQKLTYKSEAEIYHCDIFPVQQNLEEIEKDFKKWTFLKAIIDNNITYSDVRPLGR